MKHSTGLIDAGVVTFASPVSFISLSLTPRRFCSLYRCLLCLFSVTILLPVLMKHSVQPRNNPTCCRASSCPFVRSKTKSELLRMSWFFRLALLKLLVVSVGTWRYDVCARCWTVALWTRPMTHGSVATVTLSCWSRLDGRVKWLEPRLHKLTDLFILIPVLLWFLFNRSKKPCFFLLVHVWICWRRTRKDRNMSIFLSFKNLPTVRFTSCPSLLSSSSTVLWSLRSLPSSSRLILSFNLFPFIPVFYLCLLPSHFLTSSFTSFCLYSRYD